MLRLFGLTLLIGTTGCDNLFRLRPLHCATCSDAGSGSDIDGGDDAQAIDDLDGDGIADAADNCPAIKNADQRDHDVDDKGDACDPCPHLASSSADADSDGDGLGNGCDPYPTIGADTRALFIGFYTADEVSTWIQAPSGAWAVTGGLLRLANNGLVAATIEVPTTFNDIFVQISVRGASLAAGSVAHSVTISAGRTPQMRHDCTISAPTNGDPKEIRFDEISSGWSTGWGGLLTQTNPMSLLIDGTHAICAVSGSSPADLDLDPPSNDTATHMGRLGFSATLTAVDIDYVFVATPHP